MSIEYTQQCETIIAEIAHISPNTLSQQQLFALCIDICTEFPSRALDTLHTLKWQLSSGLDTSLVRGYLKRVQQAEQEGKL